MARAQASSAHDRAAGGRYAAETGSLFSTGDRTMNDELEERARRLLAGGFPVRQAAPGPQLIGFAMNCSARPRPFVVVCEAVDGDRLQMLRNEIAQGGSRDGGPVASPASLGSFRIDHDQWPGCPHCGARVNTARNMGGFWRCGRCGGFNCVGSDEQGRFHCACGRIVVDGFTSETFFEVHG
ncbi:MAG: hypothetical protein WB764_02790, partial [Xanthobacteraceae bacterium]